MIWEGIQKTWSDKWRWYTAFQNLLVALSTPLKQLREQALSSTTQNIFRIYLGLSRQQRRQETKATQRSYLKTLSLKDTSHFLRRSPVHLIVSSYDRQNCVLGGDGNQYLWVFITGNRFMFTLYSPDKDNAVWSASYKIENLSSKKFDCVHVSNAMELGSNLTQIDRKTWASPTPISTCLHTCPLMKNHSFNPFRVNVSSCGIHRGARKEQKSKLCSASFSLARVKFQIPSVPLSNTAIVLWRVCRLLEQRMSRRVYTDLLSKSKTVLADLILKDKGEKKWRRA